jgi:hypothetical protein
LTNIIMVLGLYNRIRRKVSKWHKQGIKGDGKKAAAPYARRKRRLKQNRAQRGLCAP